MKTELFHMGNSFLRGAFHRLKDAIDPGNPGLEQLSSLSFADAPLLANSNYWMLGSVVKPDHVAHLLFALAQSGNSIVNQSGEFVSDDISLRSTRHHVAHNQRISRRFNATGPMLRVYLQPLE